MKQRLKFLTWTVLLALVFLGLTLGSLQVSASPNFARTSVRGIWGLFPETLTITGTQTYTPTNSRYLLAPATTLTMTLATGGALNGDVVVFVNTVATSTVFVDTGASQGGTITLDEDADRVEFEYDGTEWVLASFIDQSNGVSGGAGSFSSLTVTGNGDVGGTFNYGSDNLYPLGIVGSGQEIECGTTSVFTGSTSFAAAEVTTPTYVVATQVTVPITTAAYLYANDPTAITVTLTSLNNTFDAGTTGIQAHYCIVGNQ